MISASETTRCRHCGTPLQHTLVDLGMSPLCESFLTEPIRRDGDLSSRCMSGLRHCLLVQLQEYVSPITSLPSTPISPRFRPPGSSTPAAIAKWSERLGLGPKSFVVELGSNDGYLLQHFLAVGVPVLGIEPAANVAESARRQASRRRWSSSAETAREVVADPGADLIIANNVLAQVPDSTTSSPAWRSVGPEGVITMEFPHLERLIDENQFDTIYHEHFSYFSLGTMTRLAAPWPCRSMSKPADAWRIAARLSRA